MKPNTNPGADAPATNTGTPGGTKTKPLVKRKKSSSHGTLLHCCVREAMMLMRRKRDGKEMFQVKYTECVLDINWDYIWETRNGCYEVPVADACDRRLATWALEALQHTSACEIDPDACYFEYESDFWRHLKHDGWEVVKD